MSRLLSFPSRSAVIVAGVTSAGALLFILQTQASVGLGVGTVRYTGGSETRTATLTPALRRDSPGLSARLGGSLAALPGDVWSTQGRAELWAVSPPLRPGVRLAADVALAGSRLTGGAWSAAAHGLGELLWISGTWGVAAGAGPSDGWIGAEPSVTALRIRARTFGRARGVSWSAGAEPTRFLGAWFTDATAVVATASARVTATAWLTARLSESYRSSAGGGAFVQIFAAPTVAIELGGGRYLPDPYQGFPRARYLSAGVRLFARRPAGAARPARAPVWPALVPERRGDSVVVRFLMPGARSVAIAGSWNEWRAVPLQRVGDRWQGTILVPPGSWHFNLLVDETDWVVPAGVTVITDDLGGMVAVMVVR